jgi:sugar/nucleoside kinase (ribokinase family)
MTTAPVCIAGWTPETALRFAQALAGLVATGLGSDAGIVSYDDTLKTMKNWKIRS